MRKDPAADTSMAAAGPPSHRAGGQAAADGTQRGQVRLQLGSGEMELGAVGVHLGCGVVLD